MAPLTGLTQPIAFAYDPGNDRLFVGNTDMADGILVYNNVSSFLFDGNIAPDRAFGPDDRVPFNAAPTSIKMTVDALEFDDGDLYVIDTSGANQNSSRIMVYTNPQTASGQAKPARTIDGPWGKLRSIEIHNNRLYAVEATNVVYVVNNAGTASGTVAPTQVTVNGANRLRAVGVFHGQTYFLDEGGRGHLCVPGDHRREREQRHADPRDLGLRDAPAPAHQLPHHARVSAGGVGWDASGSVCMPEAATSSGRARQC